MIGIPAYANMVRRGRTAFAALCLAGLAACAAADGGEPVETLILPAPQQVSVGGKTYLVEMLAVPSVFMPTTNPAKDEQPREVVDYDLAVSRAQGQFSETADDLNDALAAAGSHCRGLGHTFTDKRSISPARFSSAAETGSNAAWSFYNWCRPAAEGAGA